MAKLIFVGDMHLRPTTPVRRKGNYVEDQLDKLKQICKIAEVENAKAIVQTGDVFDKPKVTSEYIEFMRFIKNNLPCDFVTVYGNHDLIQANHGLNYKTNLGVLQNFSEKIKVLNYNDVINIENVNIIGLPYSNGIDLNNTIYESLKTYDGINICLAHTMISDEPLIYDHVLAENIKSNFDIILSGHKHGSFKTKKGNTTFVNPGSVMRSSISDIDRKPKVIVFDTETLELKDVFLKIRTDCFTEISEKIKLEKVNNNILDSFDLSKTRTNPKDILRLVANSLNTKAEILATAEEYLEN